MKIMLRKTTPKDLETVCASVIRINGTYLAHQADRAFYQSEKRGIFLEFLIHSLKDQSDFNCSYRLDEDTGKRLGHLSGGRGDITFSQKEEQSYYHITNGSSLVKLRHMNVCLSGRTIQERLFGFEQLVGPNQISKINDLQLTGRESKVVLVVRDQTFSSMIAEGSDENFFDPDATLELKEHQPIYLRSTFFLKIGKEKFNLQLFQKDKEYCLLTTVNPGLGITCQMLEKLSVL